MQRGFRFLNSHQCHWIAAFRQLGNGNQNTKRSQGSVGHADRLVPASFVRVLLGILSWIARAVPLREAEVRTQVLTV